MTAFTDFVRVKKKKEWDFPNICNILFVSLFVLTNSSRVRSPLLFQCSQELSVSWKKEVSIYKGSMCRQTRRRRRRRSLRLEKYAQQNLIYRHIIFLFLLNTPRYCLLKYLLREGPAGKPWQGGVFPKD